MYKCRWKNYGVMDEWIPESYLRNAPEVLEAWKIQLKEKKVRK